jgi:hypothetical protein
MLGKFSEIILFFMPNRIISKAIKFDWFHLQHTLNLIGSIFKTHTHTYWWGRTLCCDINPFANDGTPFPWKSIWRIKVPLRVAYGVGLEQ